MSLTYDTFVGSQILRKIPTRFIAESYEIWDDGKCLASGNVTGPRNYIYFLVKKEIFYYVNGESRNGETYKVFLEEVGVLKNHIISKFDLDETYTTKTRWVNVKTNLESPGESAGMYYARPFVGVTDRDKQFLKNEPYAVCWFFINNELRKLSFHFNHGSMPLIEVFGSGERLTQEENQSKLSHFTRGRGMKEIKFNTIQRDALLFKALIREVFPKPEKGEMYFTPQFSSTDKNIYLSNEYYDVLFKAIKNAEINGKFRSSNAEEDWLGIINSFNLAKDIQDIDYNNLQEWDL